jgi:hypothetical protein
MSKLGDLVALDDGKMGRIIDVDPEDCNKLCVHEVVRAGRVEVVERASLLRRLIMRADAFFLRVRDCGWRRQ